MSTYVCDGLMPGSRLRVILYAERIKTAATALASADRAMPHARIVDTLKEALNSSHTHWVVDIEDDATFEQIHALIIKKGVYIDQKERGYI